MDGNRTADSLLGSSPLNVLREAVRQVPPLRYALGVGGVASVVAIIVTGWKLEPQTAIIGGLIVFIGMVVLVIFSALSKAGTNKLRPLALALGWAFLALAVLTAFLFVSCAFADWPKSLPCLLRQQSCQSATLGSAATISGGSEGDHGKEVKLAATVLDGLYKEDFANVYRLFSSNVQEALPFARFRDIALREMEQAKGGPLHRKLKFPPREESGFLYVQFLSEFDTASTWIEMVTFSKIANAWSLYRVDLRPLSWMSAPTDAKVLVQGTAKEALVASEDIIGAWTPVRGWRAKVRATGKVRAERTCDLELEASGKVSLMARNVLGGCKAKPGEALDVVGKVVAKGPQRLELDEVKFVRFW
jgi:hypothetical protein